MLGVDRLPTSTCAGFAEPLTFGSCEDVCSALLDVNGRCVTYERAGSGPPVVLVHGYVGDGPSMWRPQIDGLADEIRPVAIDLPGAGGSDDLPEDCGMSGFDDAVAGFISGLDLRALHMIGLSFGGATLIELCRRHQDSVAPLTLVGAYAGWAGSLPQTEVDHRLTKPSSSRDSPPTNS